MEARGADLVAVDVLVLGRRRRSACGLDDRGALRPGAQADIVVWNVASVEEMVYRIGWNPVRRVIKRGKVVIG